MKAKIIIAIFLCNLFLLGCSSNELKREQNLSAISITEHKQLFGKYQEEGRLREYILFNEDSTIAEKKKYYYKDDKCITHKWTYIYDNKKRLIEENYYYIDTLSLNNKKVFEYNEIDSVSKLHFYLGNGELDTTFSFEYDNKKRLITKKENDLILGTFISKYTYDTYLMRIDTYNEDTYWSTIIHEYDSFGNLLKQSYISAKNGQETIERQNKYTYTSTGKIKHQESTHYESTIFKDFTYNDDETIQKIALSYPNKHTKSELRYNYIWK